MRSIFVFILAVAEIFAQTLPIPAPSPGPPLIELKQYLSLTDAQYVQLFDNMDQSRRTVAGYQQRISQLQNEIAVETARTNPDPMELGTRYAEIEQNCRSIRNESKALRDKNGGLLTDPQKAKLKTLEEALKLYPIISEAQSASLLDDSASGGYPIPVGVFVGGGFTPDFTAPGCNVWQTRPTVFNRQ
ncbi:MAG: hypothetical protein IT165_04095 [Bryobacterales bacterium]|nr:hypothetical protein [Bryobacterales bacterium]